MIKDWDKVIAKALEQPKEWQGLSDDEYIAMLIKANIPMKSSPNMAIEFGRAIEAKLKEKNT
jgi:hypothetical protein